MGCTLFGAGGTSRLAGYVFGEEKRNQQENSQVLHCSLQKCFTGSGQDHLPEIVPPDIRRMPENETSIIDHGHVFEEKIGARQVCECIALAEKPVDIAQIAGSSLDPKHAVAG